jgi:beta-glucosidase-like glycosyl hydrolase
MFRHVLVQGRQLGTTRESYRDSTNTETEKKVETAHLHVEPVAVQESNLTVEEREQQRAERAAAAELRLKKQGGLPPKKKKAKKDVPLVGPHSKPLMTWTA